MNTHFTQHPNGKSRPTPSPTAMLCKSGVCVALVAGLAWIGFATLGSGAGTDPSVNEAGAAAGAAVRGDRAAAHRREVFEERRARFERGGAAHLAQDGERPLD